MDAIKGILGGAVSVIAAEHLFSAGMSSPWSVAKFASSDEDRRQVWKLFRWSAWASIVFGLVIGGMLNGKKSLMYSVLGSVAVIAFMGYEYREALEGRL